MLNLVKYFFIKSLEKKLLIIYNTLYAVIVCPSIPMQQKIGEKHVRQVYAQRE